MYTVHSKSNDLRKKKKIKKLKISFSISNTDRHFSFHIGLVCLWCLMPL